MRVVDKWEGEGDISRLSRLGRWTLENGAMFVWTYNKTDRTPEIYSFLLHDGQYLASGWCRTTDPGEALKALLDRV